MQWQTRLLNLGLTVPLDGPPATWRAVYPAQAATLHSSTLQMCSRATQRYVPAAGV